MDNKEKSKFETITEIEPIHTKNSSYFISRVHIHGNNDNVYPQGKIVKRTRDGDKQMFIGIDEIEELCNKLMQIKEYE